MFPAAVVTIIAAFLAVVVLVAYLIRVASVLGRVHARLRAVTDALRAVPQQTAPAGSIVNQINRDLAAANEALPPGLNR